MAEATNAATTGADNDAAGERKNRKVLVGIVTGDKQTKSRRVEVSAIRKHPKYGKYLRRRTVCHAHDEENTTREGDTVEIAECRPMSKTKRWRVVRVVRPAGMVVGELVDDTKTEPEAAETEAVAAT